MAVAYALEAVIALLGLAAGEVAQAVVFLLYVIVVSRAKGYARVSEQEAIDRFLSSSIPRSPSLDIGIAMAGT
jgi:hypothetical protein